ncbi:MAG: hypothetical protein HQ579_07130 [Candidatus Omnitrophica bacterium]|nr:hypothetical protein [Candidatus Omnitrophota bacterium]
MKKKLKLNELLNKLTTQKRYNGNNILLSVWYFNPPMIWVLGASALIAIFAPILALVLLFIGILLVAIYTDGFTILHRKIFPPQEIKAVLGVFEESKLRFNNEAFRFIENIIKKKIEAQADKIVLAISKGTSPREVVYAFIANTAGDYLESGHLHIYRGELNPMGCGRELLKLFDTVTNELQKMGSWTKEQAEEEKKSIRDNIKQMG